ncbi:MAG: PAS domain S-box protein [Caulobacteraceae bacterium]
MERLWQAMDEGPAPLPTGRSRLTPYALALCMVVLGVAARLSLDPFLGDRVVFLFFVPAVLAAAATGGLVAALTATALSTLAGGLLLARYGIILGNEIDAAFFTGLGVLIAVGGDRLRRAQTRASDMARHVLERQAHIQSILDTVPDAMIVIDVNGLVHSFSPAAERLFGWTKAEVIGRNVNMLMPSPDREAHDSYLERYGRTGERRIIGTPRIILAQRKDGSAFPAELFVGETGLDGHTFYTGFLQDLTERRAAETHLQRLQSELMHISRLSDMGEMAAALAHELNQPLSAISNYLKGGRRLLETENPRSRAIPAMDKAAEQSLRAGEIIRRLRNFVARGESERSAQSVRKLLEEVVGLGLTGARERGVSARMELDPSVDGVFVDKVQVQQVALNLVRNAMEAMSDAPKRELLVKVSAAESDMAMVSVTDTGSGVSPDIADQLFQPFVSTKGGQGMGVGLSICRTIIEAHGGRIWAEPNPGGGSIFCFTVPRAEHKEVA